MDSNFKVSIYQEPCFGGLSITAWQCDGNGKRYQWKWADKPRLIEISDGSLFEPSLQLSSDVAPIFLKAMAEAIDSYGVKTDSDAKIAGTLEATREHLKDLQKLVFKGKV